MARRPSQPCLRAGGDSGGRSARRRVLAMAGVPGQPTGRASCSDGPMDMRDLSRKRRAAPGFLALLRGGVTGDVRPLGMRSRNRSAKSLFFRERLAPRAGGVRLSRNTRSRVHTPPFALSLSKRQRGLPQVQLERFQLRPERFFCERRAPTRGMGGSTENAGPPQVFLAPAGDGLSAARPSEPT